MIAAVFRGPGELEIAEIETTPEIGPDEVLVEIEANTRCGTDTCILRGEMSRGIDGGQQLVLDVGKSAAK